MATERTILLGLRLSEEEDEQTREIAASLGGISRQDVLRLGLMRLAESRATA